MKIPALDLPDRRLLSISGEDRKEFLQGLITNDINLVTPNNSIFSAFLTANGKFLADFFIYEYQDQFIIDIHQKFQKSFLQKLKLYKLRSKVVISEIEGKILLSQDQQFIEKYFPIIEVGKAKILENQIIAIDNRSEILGCRIVTLKPELLDNFTIVENSLEQYHKIRINHKIIDGAYDLTIEKSIILEYGYQDIPAINFDKGCYIGQELMTRTHRRGVLRKKIYKIRIDNINEEITQNSEIVYNDKKIGIVCFSCREKNDIYGIGLFRIDEVGDILDQKISVFLNADNVSIATNITIQK